MSHMQSRKAGIPHGSIFLVTCSRRRLARRRGCHEDPHEETAFVEFKLYRASLRKKCMGTDAAECDDGGPWN